MLTTPSLISLTQIDSKQKMELQETNSNNKNGQTSTPDIENPYNSKTLETHESQYFTEDFDSTCSTPYVSAPSSPGRPGSGPVNGGFFYSCPASPMHFAITSSAGAAFASSPDKSVAMGYEFEFSARFGSTGSGQPGSMSSADELFLNGQIRPMKLSSHLERPQMLAPLLDLENEEEDGDSSNEDEKFKKGSRKGGGNNGESMSRGRDLRLKNKSLRRRTRSMSPLRSTSFEFEDDDEENKNVIDGSSKVNDESLKLDEATTSSDTITPSVSASSSRSSSAGRNSKRWVFLKDFLYRSKSEGRSNNKFWSNISFSPAKEKSKQQSGNSVQTSVSKEKSSSSNNGSHGGSESQKVKGNSGQGSSSSSSSSSSGKKFVNGVGKRRVPASPHELHYKASRAQAEEMRKKTFLPYRQGLLGCLGFSSKGYGAMNGFARALNPVSSR